MGRVGASGSKRQEKCMICQKTFEEDELKLFPYPKTQTIELMCDPCSQIQFDGIIEEVPLTTEIAEDKIKITTTKKLNEMKELVNETQKEITPTSMCNCAKFPLCKGVRAIQAFDEFSNSEIRAYFISAYGDYYKIDFCPFCGKRLYI